MIDGIKLICKGTDPHDWENNHLLSFTSKVDEQTGEIKSDTRIAFYKGLYFFLVPSTTTSKIHCILKGSLAKFYNNGKHNAFDYSLRMVSDSIKELESRFNIVAKKAIVQHFEYGVNISTDKTTKTIIRGLRAYQNDSFTALKLDNVFNGKQIQKQEYRYKIYDKAIQTGLKGVNLLRIEIAIKSRKKAGKYGVEVLEDLINLNKLQNIKPDLIKIWKEMIFYDYGMNWRRMSKKQKEKMLYYLDATNWDKFTRKQRSRAKLNFIELKSEFCKSNTQEEILLKVESKIKELEANKCHALRNFQTDKTADKLSRFTDLDKGVKRGQIENDKTPLKKSTKNRSCIVCQKDISNKRKDAIYCSKKCNNSFHARKRKAKRKIKRKFLKLPIRLNLVNQIKYRDKIRKKQGLKPIGSIRGLSRSLGNQYPDRYNSKSFFGTLARAERKGFKEVNSQLISDLAEVLGSKKQDLFKYPIHKKNWKNIISHEIN